MQDPIRADFRIRAFDVFRSRIIDAVHGYGQEITEAVIVLFDEYSDAWTSARSMRDYLRKEIPV